MRLEVQMIRPASIRSLRHFIFVVERLRGLNEISFMAQPENNGAPPAALEEIQKNWNQFTLRIEKLETINAALEQDNYNLRRLLGNTVEYRKKSHTELVNLV